MDKENNAQNTADRKQGGKKHMSRKKRAALRRKRIRRAVIAVCVLILLTLAAIFYLNNAVIGGRIYPLSVQTIDLRGSGLTDVNAVARMSGLKEVLLGGNGITDVSRLSRLTECEYIDLTDNPIDAESYETLRKALPDCLILCEAANDTVKEMALGGYPLPDVQVLARVFASHTALETVDLRGSGLTQEQIDALCAQFEQINFIYQADGTSDTVVLNLDSAAEAADALSAVSDAAHVTLTGCGFTPDEYRALRAAFPETEIDCLISLCGQTILSSAQHIDLSGCTADEHLQEDLSVFTSLRTLTLGEMLPSEAVQIEASLMPEKLSYRYNGIEISPELTQIDLRGAEGFSAQELKVLLSVLPRLESVTMDAPSDQEMFDVMAMYQKRVRFLYEISAFGQNFGGSETHIDLGGAVTDEDMSELTALLNALPALEKVDMFESRLSKENMDMLFDGYPQIFFGWTFEMCEGKYVVRTDITAFSTQIGQPVNYYTEEHLEQLRYCKDLQALDLGHNNIKNIDFLYNFPKLKVLILVDNKFSDITPIASLIELEYLEIFMNNAIRDFTPLQNLPLRHLNICFCGDKDNKVTADVFMGITTLERFWASRTYFDKSEGQRMREALPDCTVSVTYGESTGDGWRSGKEYPVIVRMFETGVYEPIP